ncbi:hypothetical protein ASPFODRAFT_41658 [Aspergillus luchuensis CBS 106.47]|uniref:Transcription factor domain-containing protein n=1 Tax=Aspergillus luchuensis (strain CBS 106.47) TaxID=1137211 RepID=A0A1M3TWM1_ASPLC|nr:hypothetical protein ASPFODRAFT_41658 [Aspergillus luchuensis CBS 106.47]
MYHARGQSKYEGRVIANLTSETAIHYHNHCIEHLISLPESLPEIEKKNLLAAAIILRFYEEVDAPSIAEDMESAINGIQVFLNIHTLSTSPDSGNLHAAYWVILRQEALTAFAKQRPFRIPLGPCLSYRSFEPADDFVWTNRLVIHLADVLQFCFGVDEKLSTAAQQRLSPQKTTSESSTANTDMTLSERLARYDKLVAFGTYWEEHKPPSFVPIYARDPDCLRGEVFPEIWFLGSCHAIGIQHLELARILLTVYNPKVVRLGLNRQATLLSIDHEVKTIVLRLCGIATTHRSVVPALLTACIAIAMCGDRFTDHSQQEALLSILVELEEEHAWPTKATQIQLKDVWGWKEG